MADLARIKRNVAKMVSQNAPESEIDGYIATEGVTVDDVRNFKPQQEQFGATKQAVSTLGDVAATVGSGLAKGAIAAPMVLADLGNAAAEGVQLFGRGIAENVSPLLGADPQPRGEMWRPFYGSQDIAQKIGVDYQPRTTAGKIVDFPAQVAGSVMASKAITSPKIADFAGSTQSGNPTSQAIPSQEIKGISQAGFEQFDKMGGALKPTTYDKFVQKAELLKPRSAIGQELAGVDEFTDAVNVLKQYKSQPMNLSVAKEVDEILSQKIAGQFKEGRMTPVGQKLGELQDTFRDTINTATPADIIGNPEAIKVWRDAQRQWKNYLNAREVERVFERADMFDGSAKAIQTGFRQIAMNPKRLGRFDKDQQELIKKAATISETADVLRTIGSRLVGGMSIATGLGAPEVAMNMLGSRASRGLAGSMQQGRGEKVLQSIGRNVKGLPPEPAALGAANKEFVDYVSLGIPQIIAAMRQGYQPTPEEAELLRQAGVQ